MKAFDIGFVPKGWKRGQPLRVIRASERSHGRVWSLFQGAFLSPLEGFDSPVDIAAIDFTLSDAGRVDAWLRWWTEEARMEDVRRRVRLWDAAECRYGVAVGARALMTPPTDEERAELLAYDQRVAAEAGEFA